MASVNKAIIVGNLGRDPEMRYLPDGTAVANFSVATTDKYKDKSGQMVEQTEWHSVSFFGRIAEVCGQYLAKGSSVYVEGRIKTRKYTDKEGIERYATGIAGDRMQMLGQAGQRDTDGGAQPAQRQQRPAQQSRAPQQSGGNGFDDMDDDIPFCTASPAHDPILKKLRGMA